MNLHASFVRHLETRFADFFKSTLTIHDARPVHGGDINQCYRLETSSGPFFMKVNASLFGLDFFEKEARGLMLLADTSTIRVPRPLFDGKFHQEVYLVMEALSRGTPAPGFWESFGQSMATLHRNSSDTYGLDYPNYIGRLHQDNTRRSSWHEFYANQRIMCLAYKAKERQLLDMADVESAEKICSRLLDLVPEERPSLLHGDIWSGNYLVTDSGMPAIFDPSVYYGHRETDLAMSLLFGGFDQRFYASYQEAWALQPGWEDRVPLFQLYPLLVHLLLFGGPYRDQVQGILKKFS